MKWLWHLHRDWKKRAEDARAEVSRSRRNLEYTRAQVLRPLAEWRRKNHFGQLIQDSLLEGSGKR